MSESVLRNVRLSIVVGLVHARRSAQRTDNAPQAQTTPRSGSYSGKLGGGDPR